MADSSQTKADQALKIRFEQLKLLFEPTKFVIIANTGVVIMLAIMQWSVIDHSVIVTWLIAMGMVIASRLWLAVSFYKKAPDWHEVKKWEKRFFISVVAAGIAWGAASLMLFPPIVNLRQERLRRLRMEAVLHYAVWVP